MTPYEYGEETDFVEIPISWSRDNIPLMLFIKQPLYHAGYKSPEMMYEEYYKDSVSPQPSQCWCLYVHYPPGLPHMTDLFADLIQYVKRYEDAEFAPPEVVARKFKDDPWCYEIEGKCI